MPKNKIGAMGIVYSTDPAFKLEAKEQHVNTLAPAQQKLRVKLETKQRAGKAVTLIEGFAGIAADADALGKNLKSFCGTGGSVKEGEILVQGDNREKILGWLIKKGYTQTKKAG